MLRDRDVVVLDDLTRGLGVQGSEARPKDDVTELKPPAAFFFPLPTALTNYEYAGVVNGDE